MEVIRQNYFKTVCEIIIVSQNVMRIKVYLQENNRNMRMHLTRKLHLGIILLSSGYHMKVAGLHTMVIWASYDSHMGTILWSRRSHFMAIWVSFWDGLGVILGSSGGHFVIMGGLFWYHRGVILLSLGGHFGIILGFLEGHFGKA